MLLATLVCAIYTWGYFFDPSVATSENWADQRLYLLLAEKLSTGSAIAPQHLHYQIGYPLLGAIAAPFSDHPFYWIGLGLLAGSVMFVYLGARAELGIPASALMVVLLFYWDFHARSMYGPMDMFVVPWNNQVVFFAFCYFFWAFANRISPALFIATGALAGFTVATREETVIFLVPLLLGLGIRNRIPFRIYALAAAAAFVTFLPQLIVKVSVLGSALDSGRGTSYVELASRYLDFGRLIDNLHHVIYASTHEAARLALLQASPWLWLAPIGLLLTRRPIFVLVSIGLALFYLAGENMSDQKLKFHCLRYITSSLVAFTYGVAALADKLLSFTPRLAARRESAGAGRDQD